MTPREKWNAHVAVALTEWRLFNIGPRPNSRYDQQLIRSAIADVLAIRLRVAYDPLFRTLRRIDRDMAGIAQLASNRDPWAPKKNRPEAVKV